MDIPLKTNILARKYGTRNPFRIAESLDVLLVLHPLDGINGFYQYFQKNNIIYIDERLSETEKMFVCAHEIGHMLLHKNSNAIFLDSRTHLKTSKYELEADRFAINLLIGDDIIEENLDYTTEQFSRLLGYNKKLIELRLKDFI